MNGRKLNLDDRSSKNLYIQIYETIKGDIISGAMPKGSKLPSLRRLAEDNGISVTTVETAYDQLLVEGYIESRPKSGYYVSDRIEPQGEEGGAEKSEDSLEDLLAGEAATGGHDMSIIYDEESFDFSKWKKCMNRVFNEYSHVLMTEADVQGEPALRYEIAKYLLNSRGVKCSPERIVVGAGSQQLTKHLIRILRRIGIRNVATETPGYGPIREVFSEDGFLLSRIPVNEDGIEIEKLPINMRSLVCVSPSNHLPSGAVMPIGRRYELIKWASENDSYIFEDDYDSELRYFGRPIPALSGIDRSGRVIYLGSFSSTLFESIKISYMVLPEELMTIYDEIKDRYGQTCSKSEQICLALYMEEGHYYRHNKKLRRLYASKLDTTMKLFEKEGSDRIEAVNSQSGMTVMLRVKTDLTADRICSVAETLGLMMRPVDDLCTDEVKVVSFYFYRVSEALLTLLIKMFVKKIKNAKA